MIRERLHPADMIVPQYIEHDVSVLVLEDQIAFKAPCRFGGFSSKLLIGIMC